MNKNTLHTLFGQMGQLIADQNKVIEIAVYGNAAMHLIFDGNQFDSGDKVDYLPISADTEALDAAEYIIRTNYNLDRSWFTDSIKRITSPVKNEDHEDMWMYGDFPAENPGLRVYVANPDYLLSMKSICFNAHDAEELHGLWTLISETKINSMKTLNEKIAQYYPGHCLDSERSEILGFLISQYADELCDIESSKNVNRDAHNIELEHIDEFNDEELLSLR